MADDEVVRRCHAGIQRAREGHIDDAEMDRFVVDVTAMDPDDPQRAGLAATMVHGMTVTGTTLSPTVLGRLSDLLPLAGENPPFMGDWPKARTVGRFLGAMAASTSNSLAKQAAGARELEALRHELRDAPEMLQVLEMATSMLEMLVGMRSEHGADRGQAIERFKVSLASLRHVPGVEEMVALLSNMSAITSGSLDDPGFLDKLDELEERSRHLPPQYSNLTEAIREWRQGVTQLMAAYGTDVGAEHPMTVPVAPGPSGDVVPRLLASAALMRGGQETDLGKIDTAIQQCREAIERGEDDEAYAFALTSLAVCLLRRAEVAGDNSGLDEAEKALDRAVAVMGDPGHPHWQFTHDVLSDLQRRRGKIAKSGEVGMAAQRGFAWQALLSHDAADVRTALEEAAEGAIDVARKYAMATDLANVVRALDTCRGLLLFAQMGIRDIPGQLAAIGRQDLAERWTAEGNRSTMLRREALAALAASGSAAGLMLDPPSFAEIRAALREVDADALVYLVPAGELRPGMAVIAPASCNPAFMALPALTVDSKEVDGYLTALSGRSSEIRSTSSAPTRETAPVSGSAFADRVNSLCDWAWRAAIGPLMESYFARNEAGAEGKVPRIVLVPMGDLARVPWQAARRGDGTYAVQLASFSHAVSARLFCENAAKSPVALSSTGLVVGDPDTEGAAASLPAARAEAHAIRRTFYRPARYVGRRLDGKPSHSGRGTAAQVRAWLTDPSSFAGTMLHLACHGVFDDKDKNVRAELLLAPNEPGVADSGALAADEIIALMSDAPQRRIGLVVMAACHTNRSIHGYDEAYSLGTAFLAGGVRSVLSTQWAVPDSATSSLMFLFHYFLRERGMRPREALREAQMWMLDPNRLHPECMPEELRAQSADERNAQVLSWAGFVHYGQ
ncbi:CHAT domain-containing protein [Kutzneria sp. NPDC051319]|uniref:CHAT domain-containing protein n=1 Tax=Kutzneria sp. NPDC051319 TaxID=3155047 RepID=UPI00342032C9